MVSEHMEDASAPPLPLSPGVVRFLDAAEELAEDKSMPPGIFQWLLAALERYGPMAESMTEQFRCDQLLDHVRKKVRLGERGEPLDSSQVLQEATALARAASKDRIREHDVVAIILGAAGYAVKPQVDADSVVRDSQAPGSTVPSDAESSAESASFCPRATRPTPALEQFGRDLTRAAANGTLGSIVGREDEIDLMIETLCRRTKRNPVLVGPAGVGKTAIVEGLAQRIVRDTVPAALKGVRVVEIQPSSLVAGSGVVGELQERVKAVIADASQDGIILFVDEVHSIIGAGGPAGSGDVASLLKPALARGDLACIAATTDEEYRRFVEPDAALERRFQPVRVQELSTGQVVTVLREIANDLARLRGVRVGEETIGWLVQFADQFLKSRYFPDKAVDLLEQCVAHALTHGKQTVSLTDAEEVAHRMVGMPTDLAERLDRLRSELSDRALVSKEDEQALLRRLSVTMRGLDLRAERPNAIVLLAGAAAGRADRLAEAVAGALFGSPQRVVKVDFGRFTQPSDVTRLVGAPPGYVGYDDATPLHRVAQMPWCVLLCENVDCCHPSVAQVLSQALADGSVADARGRRIFLSDSVVLMTANPATQSHHAIGFQRSSPSPAHDIGALADVVGTELMDQVDLVCTSAPPAEGGIHGWLQRSVISELSRRYRQQGVELDCDRSLLQWLAAQCEAHHSQRDWERLVDEHVSPAIIEHLGRSDEEGVRRITVLYEGGMVHIQSD